MANILEILPPETLIHICSFLDKQDVKAGRLTSKVFNNCSVEFLLDRAVVAARYGTLDALKLIIEHPIFTRTVKSLIFDTSSFAQELTSKEKYAYQFKKLFAHCSPEELRFYFLQPFYEESSRSEVDTSLPEHPSPGVLAGKGFSCYCQLYDNQEEIRSLGLDRLLLTNALQKCLNVRAIYFDAKRGSLSEDIRPELKDWCLKPRAWKPEPISWVDPGRFNPALDLPGKIRSWSSFGFNIQRMTISFKAIWPDAWRFPVFIEEDPQFPAAFSKVKYLELSFPAYNGATEYLDQESVENDVVTNSTKLPSFQVAHRARRALDSGGAANMAILISMASNLEHLRVDFGTNRDFIWQRIHILFDSDPSFLAGRADAQPNQLKTLEVIGMGFTIEDLSGILEKYRGVLKNVSLNNVGLLRGSWRPLLQFMKGLQLHQLHILDVWGGVIPPGYNSTEYFGKEFTRLIDSIYTVRQPAPVIDAEDLNGDTIISGPAIGSRHGLYQG
ncbi:MAG: hypothetical protein M1836_004073 [Candelina mexicana]|nr:MAG: hypothetical protein M1836_004073 [Candelina mexicana]